MLFLSGVNPARCVFNENIPERVDERWVEVLVRFGARTPPAVEPQAYPPPPDIAAYIPRLYVQESERRECRNWIAGQGWQGRELILVQPSNHRTLGWRRGRRRQPGADDKAWPLERWVELLRRIHQRMPQATILLRGAPDELPVLTRIQSVTGIDAVACAGLTLRQTFALCEFAHSMISVDTGPAHAAAALGLPLVVLYGAMPQRVWVPRGAGGSPVIGLGGPPHSTRVDQTSVDAVFDAWCTLTAQIAGHCRAAARRSLP
jgi:heptosyltransferase-2/heptosyltransferase-3